MDEPGLIGFNYEPEYTEEELEQMVERGGERRDDAGDEQEDDGRERRLGNTTWCQCDQCTAMPTEKESLCCAEEDANLLQKLHDGFMECITEHPDFTSICLTPPVLEVMMHCLREVRGYGQVLQWENR